MTEPIIDPVDLLMLRARCREWNLRACALPLVPALEPGQLDAVVARPEYTEHLPVALVPTGRTVLLVTRTYDTLVRSVARAVPTVAGVRLDPHSDPLDVAEQLVRAGAGLEELLPAVTIAYATRGVHVWRMTRPDGVEVAAAFRDARTGDTERLRVVLERCAPHLPAPV